MVPNDLTCLLYKCMYCLIEPSASQYAAHMFPSVSSLTAENFIFRLTWDKGSSSVTVVQISTPGGSSIYPRALRYWSLAFCIPVGPTRLECAGCRQWDDDLSPGSLTDNLQKHSHWQWQAYILPDAPASPQQGYLWNANQCRAMHDFLSP